MKGRVRFLGYVAVVLALNAVSTPCSWAAQDKTFDQANQAFSEGRFGQAIDGYESLVRSGRWSANLFYDLGNAWFRQGDLGRAILNYERALALEPRHPETQANLRLAREEARALEMEQLPIERYLSAITVPQYTIMTSVAFWAAVFITGHIFFQRRRSGKLTILAIALFALSVGGAVELYLNETGNRGQSFAIITGKQVQARLATADNAKGVLSLPAGSQIKVLSKRGEWIYAALPNSLRGWIPAAEAEQVRF
jgi:tetratricopeptide (TPR) repeat protein